MIQTYRKKEEAWDWGWSSQLVVFVWHVQSSPLSPALHKPGVVVHACNSSAWQMEARGSEIQCHLHLTLSEFKANLIYLKPCLKTKG